MSVLVFMMKDGQMGRLITQSGETISHDMVKFDTPTLEELNTLGGIPALKLLMSRTGTDVHKRVSLAEMSRMVQDNWESITNQEHVSVMRSVAKRGETQKLIQEALNMGIKSIRVVGKDGKQVTKATMRCSATVIKTAIMEKNKSVVTSLTDDESQQSEGGHSDEHHEVCISIVTNPIHLTLSHNPKQKTGGRH